MPIYKRCGRCGKRLESGSKCDCMKQRYKDYDHFSRDKNSYNFYHSKEWINTQPYILDLDGGIDVYVFMTTGEVIAADTVHHIVPLKDDWNRRLDETNLISLHHDTHSMIEQKYKKDKRTMQDLLVRLLCDYRKERGGAV